MVLTLIFLKKQALYTESSKLAPDPIQVGDGLCGRLLSRRAGAVPPSGLKGEGS